MWGALSDERMGLSFTTAAGPRPFYNFGASRIQITTSNISCTIACLFVVTKTCVSEPFSSNGLFRLSGVMSQYIKAGGTYSNH
jgi:hypothetical protein